MADSQQQQWAATLREDELTGLSAADAAFAAGPEKKKAAFDDGEPRNEVEADRLASTEGREQAYQSQNLKQRSQGQGVKALAKFAPPQVQAALKVADAVPGGGAAVDAVIKVAQKRFRMTMWIAIVGGSETVIISIIAILALDILYISQRYSAKLRRFVPKPKQWEVIALVSLTSLLIAVVLMAIAPYALVTYILEHPLDFGITFIKSFVGI